ncbi:hypothetical protein FRC07_004918, partial [Ceratobasidium sp. 392]
MALDQPIAEPEPEFPVIAVSSAELVQIIIHPNDSSKRIHLFSQSLPTSVQHIAFAIGPFIAHTVPDPTSSDPTTTTATPTPIRTYTLPSSSNASLELATTSAPLRPAMSFYTTEYGSYPFGTLSAVFLPTIPATTSYDAAGLVLLPTTLLHTSAHIDAAFDARLALAHALAAQWAGVHIVPRTPTDSWLVLGVQGYVAGLCIRRMLGNNEWRFRLKVDAARCVALDDGSFPPISRPSCARSFVRLKAPLVLHTLDRILGAHGGLGRVLPKIFLSALSGELAQNALGTTAFVRMCRKLGGGSGGSGGSGGGGVGGEVRAWARQWVYGSGCPRFYVSAGFSRKKMAVELTVEQRCLAWERNGGTAGNVNVEYNPVKSFEGQMAVRIHEADGTPYEHVLDLRDGRTRFEVPFNTKYKRVRRRRRGEAPVLENGALPDGENGDAAGGAVGGVVGGGGAVFEYAPWDDPETRVAWHVEEFEDAEPTPHTGPVPFNPNSINTNQGAEETAYEWIRLDAEMSWLARIEFKQPGVMWASQLARERDVGAQLEAVWAFGGGGNENGPISGLANGISGGSGVLSGTSPGSYSSFAAIQPSGAVSTALAQTVLVPTYFFRVRCAAARALAAQGAPGLFHLLKIWTRWCYEPGSNDGSGGGGAGDGFAQRDKTKKGESEMLVKVLKKEVGRSKQLRDSIMPIMLAPDVDHEVRWCMLKLADLIYRPAEEPPVKLKIHLPMTPVTEMPPSLPTPSAASGLPKKPQFAFAPASTPAPASTLPPPVRQTPTSLKLSLPSALPKLKFVGSGSPRMSATPLPPLVPPAAPSPLAFESTPGKNGIPLPDLPSVPAPAPAPLPEPEPESATIPLPRPKKIKPSATPGAPQGMNKTSHAHCKAVLNTLNRNPHANVFRLPVDPVRDLAPNYFDIIKHPMDLSTMKAKLDNKGYRDRAGFEADFKLMIQNAKTYNAPKSFVYGEALALEKAFIDRWAKIDAAASAAHALEMEPAPPIASTSKISFSAPAPPAPSSSAPPTRKLSFIAHSSSSGLLETPTRVKSKPSFFPTIDATPRPKDKEQINVASPSPADLKSRTPKIKLVTRPPKAAPTPQAAPSRAPSPPPPPPLPVEPALISNDDALDDLLLEEVLAIETESEMKKEKGKADLLSREQTSTPAPPPFRGPPASGSATPAPLKIGKTMLKLPRPSTPSAISVVEKKASRPSTPSLDTLSDRERTPAVTTKVRIIEKTGGSSKLSKPSKPSTLPVPKPKDTIVREKPVAKDPFQSLLGSNSKGKAKQAASPAPALPIPSASSSSTAATSSAGSQKIDVKKCERILASLKRVENAGLFERPVDPVKDGCPTYLVEIKHPMDLGTMGIKLRSGKYKTMEAFKDDFDLVVRNCKKFNYPGTFPVVAAENMEVVFEREWTKGNTEPRKISSGDRRALVSMLDKLSEQPCALWFLVAVDPIAQNVPDYHNIIPKRDARDLSMIKSNVERGHYDSFDALTADLYLMQSNAAKFNGEHSQVAGDARAFVKSYEAALANFKRKRKGPDAFSGGGGAKKQ